MPNPKHKLNREDMMAFLLGELEESEQSRIESMFLVDETLRDELENAKSELFLAYQSGRLDARRSGVFEERYLPASIEKDRQEFRKMLAQNEAERNRDAREPLPPQLAAAGRQSAAQASDSASSTQSAESSKHTPGSVMVPASPAKRSRLALMLLAGLLIIGSTAAAVVAFGVSDDSATGTEVSLRSFSVRGKSQLITLPPGPEVVLRLPHSKGASFASYRVRSFFGEEVQELNSAVSGDDVTVTITRASLREGRHDLELSGVQSDGASQVLGYYSFQK